ncbi:MAG: hypothetical protein IJ389_03950 [Clostridia bacterium]|nr:hypothetical protein [Clostridia bacterium]
MKRYISIIFVMILLILFSSCAQESTTKTLKKDDYLYGIGETVNFYDIESEAWLGSITVEEIFIISDKVFYEGEEIVGYSEDDGFKYGDKRYEGMVQICYSYERIDSAVSISGSNFAVYDRDGNPALLDPEKSYNIRETEYESFVVGVCELDEGLTIGVSLHAVQKPCAWIAVNYDGTDVQGFEEVFEDKEELENYESGTEASNIMEQIFIILGTAWTYGILNNFVFPVVIAVAFMMLVPCIAAVICLVVVNRRLKKKVRALELRADSNRSNVHQKKDQD